MVEAGKMIDDKTCDNCGEIVILNTCPVCQLSLCSNCYESKGHYEECIEGNSEEYEVEDENAE